MRFELATADTIIFGAGSRKALPDRVRQAGVNVFLVTGGDASRADSIRADLQTAGLKVTIWPLGREPTLEDARRATEAARHPHSDAVVAIGGGSVIDLGKATAALLTNPGDPLDYVEVIGRGQPIGRRAAPFFALPTTAGTGAEVTRNAVLTSPADGVKVSLRSPLLLPHLAVVDPELTISVTPELTAATGMDALTQLIEPFVSVRANPLTDAVCLDGLGRVAGSLRRAVQQGGDLLARTEMALASLFGGMALASAGLGAVHGFAAPIGGRFQAPHGAVCAALLPAVMRANIHALRARGSDDAIERFTTIARVLTGRSTAAADDGVDWLLRLRDDLRIPGLSAYGVGEDDAESLADAASRANSMRTNPIALDPEQLIEILRTAL
jgi:alcohol dehydrogenase class IV